MSYVEVMIIKVADADVIYKNQNSPLFYSVIYFIISILEVGFINQ